MKTTIEIPDQFFRRAKAAAAAEGKSLKSFFTEALSQRLAREKCSLRAGRPLERTFGGLEDLHRENKRIERLIESEFEMIHEEG